MRSISFSIRFIAIYLIGHDDEGDVGCAAFVKGRVVGDVQSGLRLPFAHLGPNFRNRTFFNSVQLHLPSTHDVYFSTKYFSDSQQHLLDRFLLLMSFEPT